MRTTSLAVLALCLLAAVPVSDPARDKAADALIAAAFEGEKGAPSLPAGGRELFDAVLARPLFLRAEVGPFDVVVCQADGLKKAAEAKKTLQRACAGLEPLAELMAREFPASAAPPAPAPGAPAAPAAGAAPAPPAEASAPAGGTAPDPGAAPDADGDGLADVVARPLITGRRFTVVLTSSKDEEASSAFAQVVALLDRCEDGEFSGYKPDLPVWNPQRLASGSVNTWEVLVLNLASPGVREQGQGWFDHGLGYSAALLVSNRLLYRGAYGPVPPWLLQGLTDELDIQAYGSAWVAAGESSSWSTSTSGWRNAGWEGFVPQGGHPPPPVTGPPSGNATKSFSSKVASDEWLERANSETRHWGALVTDLKSEIPVSLASMAAAQTFTPRDRAWSRCVLHLMLDIARSEAAAAEPAGPQPGLLQALDHESQPARSGLRDGEPLPHIVARVLGTPVLAEQPARTLGEFLGDIERGDLAERVTRLEAVPLLALTSHAEQADWLYTQPQFDDRTRLSLFLLIVEVENYRELREWELLGQRLDAATRAALGASKAFPAEPPARAAAAAAFHGVLTGS